MSGSLQSKDVNLCVHGGRCLIFGGSKWQVMSIKSEFEDVQEEE